jgi:hypothetical protein
MQASLFARRQAVRLVSPFRFVLGHHAEAVAVHLLNRRRKRFIRPELSVSEFFAKLNAREVRYVVLRWFEDLPNVEPGHDLDILVADEDLRRLDGLMTHWPLGQAIDVYSTSGLHGYAYSPWPAPGGAAGEMAVFPPYLAREMLDEAVLHRGRFRVPNPRHHFLSLAYHAVYLKGARSGLRSDAQADVEPLESSHDYASVLMALAREVGIALQAPPTLERLDDVLAQHGWRPPEEILERLAGWSPWVRARFLAEPQTTMSSPPGLAVFFVRERAVASGLKPAILDLIEGRGFEILRTVDLDPPLRQEVTRAVRGGNWGAGPWPLSGGSPACAVIALDVMPAPATAADRERHPLLDNHRVRVAKDMVRLLANGALAPGERYNAVHSTDNARQAWRVARMLLDEGDAEAVASIVRRRIVAFNAGRQAVRDLTRFGNRSKVELIPWGDGTAVRKTFKPNFVRFMQREVEALRALSDRPEVPRLLEIGENHFVIERFNEQVHSKSVPRLLPLNVVRQLADFVKHCVAAGYDPIDLTPRSNIIVDPQAGLKVIDFEFCYRRVPTPPPDEAYCLVGIPSTFKGDVPGGVAYIHDPYPTEWYPYTGLDLGSFLHAPRWRQHVRRALNYPGIVLAWALRPAWPRLKAAARRTRFVRRLGGRRAGLGLGETALSWLWPGRS